VDLATTIGHETSHAMDDQDQQDPDPDINTSTSASASTNQHVSNNFAVFILHLSDLIITIIAIGVLFIGINHHSNLSAIS
jgi:hypothetical protein